MEKVNAVYSEIRLLFPTSFDICLVRRFIFRGNAFAYDKKISPAGLTLQIVLSSMCLLIPLPRK
jgi:hypothetical protein